MDINFVHGPSFARLWKFKDMHNIIMQEYNIVCI